MKSEKEEEFLKMLSVLPDVLIKKREKLGISQKELGKKLGMSQQQINRYERDRYASVKLKRLVAIAAILFTWNDAARTTTGTNESPNKET